MSVFIVFVLASMLLGACAGAAPVVAGGGKVEASSVAYTGMIESINGSQWVVNGQTITVDPSVAGNGAFNVGDVVKVEVNVGRDGSLTLTSVEIPSQTDLADLPGLGNDNSNDANGNDANDNGVNGNDVNGNDDNSSNANDNNVNSNDSNDNGNDNNSNGNSSDGSEVYGLVDVITATSITIGGQTYEFQTGIEITGLIQSGDFVKIHLVQNADGTFSVRELELSDPTEGGNDNTNDNSNDDNGNNGNSNDNDDDENENDDDDNSNSNSNDNDNGDGGGHGNSNDNGNG